MTKLPVDFMQRVVAWPGSDQDPGYINFHWLPPENRGHGLRGKPFKDLHEFMNFTQYASAKPSVYKEIFFCLSTQKVTGKTVHGHATAHRHTSQALWLKSIWIDIDVKAEKGYPSKEEALDALIDFCGGAKLPSPSAIVYSGGGIHAYWISETPLTREQWQPYADGLKSEIMRLGLKCDAGLTTDAARVLRIPGTFNNKISGTPRVVKLAHLGASYDFGKELARLATLVPPRAAAPSVSAAVTKAAPAFDLTGWGPPPVWQGAPVESLSAGIAGAAALDLPLLMDEVIKGCSHFQDCATTKGKSHGQGLWALTLLATTFFENGRGWARNFSKGYPTYDKGETDAKYDEKLKAKSERNLGWPSCGAFEAEGAKCKSCPFYGKLRSPLALAGRARASTVVSSQGAMVDGDGELPEGYLEDERGWISVITHKTIAPGMTVEEPTPLFMCKLKNFVAQAGDRRLNFETSLDGSRWGRASITEMDLTSEQSLVRALRRDGVKPYVPNQRHIGHFMTSFLAKLDAAKNRIQTLSYGWLRNPEGGALPIGFAYGGRAVMSDGTTQVAGQTDSQIDQFYAPKGDPQPWLDACNLVTKRHHPALELIIATSFAAPLMFATGLYNGIYCAWSPESGAHKSTSIAIGAAVWGAPKLTKERPLSSQKGVVRKMGFLKNLPVYWDEISKQEKMDDVQEILGHLTEGGGGSKLRQDRTLFELEEWQTLMLIGSNMSLMSNITRTVANTDAQLERVYEFQVAKRFDTGSIHKVSTLINDLDYNYGHMGMKYSEYLGLHPDLAQALVTKTIEDLVTATNPNSSERFRMSMAATAFAGATIANSLGCTFNLSELWDFIVSEFIAQREIIASANIVAGNAVNTANTLTQFLKASTRNVLWVGSMPVRRAGKPDAIVYLGGPTRDKPDPIHVRFCVHDRVMQISKHRLSDFLERIKHTPRPVFDSLHRHFGAKELQRVNLALGAGVIGGREPIFEIPIPEGSPFEADLYTGLPVDQRPVAPPLVTVTETVAKAQAQAAADLRTAGLGLGL